MISFVLFPQALQPCMNFNISELVYFGLVVAAQGPKPWPFLRMKETKIYNLFEAQTRKMTLFADTLTGGSVLTGDVFLV